MDLVWELKSVRNAVLEGTIGHDYIDDTIYHYTSPDSLNGILFKPNSPALWFSRFDCLNDKSEGIEIVQLYQQAVRKERERNTIDNDYFDLIEPLLPSETAFFLVDLKPSNSSDNLPSSFTTSSVTDTFICSFSKASDDLAMWNYYVKGNRYEGYSIGVNPERMLTFITPKIIHSGFHFNLLEVIYDTDTKLRILSKLITLTYEKYCASPKGEDEKTLIKDFIKRLLATLRFVFKSNYFKHEQEVRAIFTLSKSRIEEAENQFVPTIKYRYSNGITIPFFEFSFDQLQSMVDSVTIGPVNLEPAQREAQCDILRERLSEHYPHTKVYYSKAPVRY